jgi:hypothetical protein
MDWCPPDRSVLQLETLGNARALSLRQVLGSRVVCVILVAWGARARADGNAIAGGSPRAIGRAGVGTASDDGGGALLLNPAALARRDTKRAQIGVAFADDSVEWIHSASAPVGRDQSGSSTLPFVAAEGALGDWVIGAGAMTAAVSDRVLRDPGSLDAAHYGNAFEYRYTGLAGSVRRDTVTIGAARRLGDAVALGLAIAGSRVSVGERRALWAGFVDRKDVLGDPARDVEVGITAEDSLSPSAVAGILVAPADSRVELAASLGWAATAHVEGEVAAASVSADEVTVQTTAPTAALDVHEPVTIRTGARWLGERFVAELDTDLWLFPAAADTQTWRLRGVTIVDRSNVGVALDELPSRLSERTHGALRGALDVELIGGFLWATGCYAYTGAATGRARRSTTFGDLSGHTVALGLEASAGGFTVTLGWSRTWSVKRAEQVSVWRLDNPFGAGDAEVPNGTYDASSDLVGISIDAELEAPAL